MFESSPGTPGALAGDPLRLKQVILNLVGNAVKFTSQARIVVATGVAADDADGVTLQVSVADAGIGMTEEQQARLFQSFIQADNSITRQFGGTGLGLAIARDLVRKMGGDIAVKSRPGHGSTFSFTARFGRVNKAGTEAVMATRARRDNESEVDDQASAGLAGAYVLVADDNDINQQVAREILEGVGVRVDLAGDGETAVRQVIAVQGRYDAVFMDIQMPFMDGFAATSRIREAFTADQVPVIAMTAHATVEERERCFAAGMDAHVAKPIDPDTLFATLRKFVKAPIDAAIQVRGRVGVPDGPGVLPPELPGIDVAGGVQRFRGTD